MFAWTNSMFYSIQHSIWDLRLPSLSMIYILNKPKDEITCSKKENPPCICFVSNAYLFLWKNILSQIYFFYLQYLNCMVFPLYNVFTSVSLYLQKTSTTLRIKSLRDKKINFLIKHLMVVLKITKIRENKWKQNTYCGFKNIFGRQFSRI